MANFATASEGAKEAKFDYRKMTHYELLNVSHQASDKEMKVAYHKMAKKYHPDIYKGINKDHFKRVNEAYSVLKNPQKRQAYDNRSKIRARRDRQERHGPGGSDDEEGQKGPKVRDYQDPEFEAAFRQMNTQLEFA